MIVNTNQINVDVAQLWNYNQFICILRATPVLVSLYKCIKKWKKKYAGYRNGTPLSAMNLNPYLQ